MTLLLLGLVMLATLVPVWLYDISAFYVEGYRLSRKARKFWSRWFYASVLFMCIGVWWLYLNFLFDLVF